MKTVYVLRTSEDGRIGIFTNVKKAYNALNQLLSDNEVNRQFTYNKVLKDIREGLFMEMIEGNWYYIESDTLS